MKKRDLFIYTGYVLTTIMSILISLFAVITLGFNGIYYVMIAIVVVTILGVSGTESIKKDSFSSLHIWTIIFFAILLSFNNLIYEIHPLLLIVNIPFIVLLIGTMMGVMGNKKKI